MRLLFCTKIVAFSTSTYFYVFIKFILSLLPLYLFTAVLVTPLLGGGGGRGQSVYITI